MRYNPTAATRPAVIPADAVGFISTRADKPGRFAVFLADGALQSTFGFDRAEVEAALVAAGFVVDAKGVFRRVA